MPTVSNFTQIQGNNSVIIGDNNPSWLANFNTSGRDADSPAFLILNVAHLTHANVDAVVKINGTQIGGLRTYRPGGPDIDTTNINQPEKLRQPDHWYTQMIAFAGSQINNGTNTIEILAATLPESSPTNQFDDFVIKNVMCFFHVVVS